MTSQVKTRLKGLVAGICVATCGATLYYGVFQPRRIIPGDCYLVESSTGGGKTGKGLTLFQCTDLRTGRYFRSTFDNR